MTEEERKKKVEEKNQELSKLRKKVIDKHMKEIRKKLDRFLEDAEGIFGSQCVNAGMSSDEMYEQVEEFITDTDPQLIGTLVEAAERAAEEYLAPFTEI
jgi:ElaB/YqjD/DUF883 family membrane-anchored ribosome-binding protein